MEIRWSIDKKRGNFRPVLSWSITLEPAEKELGMAPLAVDTKIPMPAAYWESHCYPGQHERSGKPVPGSWEVITPAHKSGKSDGRMILPWRENNAYPEVITGFERVREAMEKVLAEAAASTPMHEEEKMALGIMVRKQLAPGLAADRMLSSVLKRVA
ncbi:hypothetical protein [Desulfobotulus mexicanus]|uniref:Uncharacterized protein n=1 Tax=Desulfobotulus mexicanus TaxID=2586642 RepID=A0A5S5MBZ0_9BACT|nr:hypothetical protein [Desulfobotulus mexicanus]TYT73246.1 hypothetical protein FIM25_16165 [Desulfobotulus mexicanus]